MVVVAVVYCLLNLGGVDGSTELGPPLLHLVIMSASFASFATKSRYELPKIQRLVLFSFLFFSLHFSSFPFFFSFCLYLLPSLIKNLELAKVSI